MAEAEGDAKRGQLAKAEAVFASDHPVTAVMERGKAEQVIPSVVASTDHALLLMGAYGHSPIRRMIVGRTTTEMVRPVKATVLMVRCHAYRSEERRLGKECVRTCNSRW